MDNSDGLESEQRQKNEHLKRFQKIINTRHPFGIRIWKPALYDKHRSIEGNTYYDLHSYPTDRLEWKVIFNPGNILWTLLFGWWIGLAYIVVAVIFFLPLCLAAAFVAQGMDAFDVDNSRLVYRITQQLCLFGKCSRCIIDAGIYFAWPFGRLVKIREHQISGSSNEYENNYIAGRRPSGSDNHSPDAKDENNPLARLLHSHSPACSDTHNDSISCCEDKRIFIFIFRMIYVTFLAPLNMLAAIFCMFLIFLIPMTQLNFKITKHIYHSPLTAAFLRDGNVNYLPLPISRPGVMHHGRPCGIVEDGGNLIDTVLCVKSAIGRHYYKHTIKGINVVFVNLSFIALYSLMDYYGVSAILGKPLSSDTVLFITSLMSTIPLTYFIGMSVASITSETGSLALGAVVNATFGSVIEIILYVLAIYNNEEKIVEGAIVGSLLASLLALPGLSMMFGALRIPVQKFSSKLAGITCTTLIGAMVATFLPTLFQSIYGSYGIFCSQDPGNSPDVPPRYDVLGSNKLFKQQGCTIVRDRLDMDVVYNQNTTKLVHASSIVLIVTYLVGLYFTLSPSANKSLPNDMRTNIHSGQDSSPSNALHAGIGASSGNESHQTPIKSIDSGAKDPHRHQPVACTSGVSAERNKNELPDRAQHPKTKSNAHNTPNTQSDKYSCTPRETYCRSRKKSVLKNLLTLLGCTIIYSFLAEIIAKTISKATHGIAISPKLLGLTAFALVPMATEFYNAVSFAMNKNIALGLEIGSAYMAQALMIQIPVLVLFSTYYYGISQTEEGNHSIRYKPGSDVPNMGFTMIFSSWDMYVCLFACLVFLRVYVEGKSNFFKGAVLFLTYSIIVTSYFLIPRI